MTEYEILQGCLAAVRQVTDFVPKLGIVLGSGLGGFADEIEPVCAIAYADIPGFPRSTAPGHVGRLVFGYAEETPVAVLQGRVHLYEGYTPAEVVRPVRLLRLLGAGALFLTNASGGITKGLSAGSFLLLRDHISCFVPNPLIGANIGELGVRFPDCTEVYDRALRETVRSAAAKNGIPLSEGVYAQLTGPSFESPAEIRMLSALGADAVGMSTVVEAIAAVHCGLRVAAISSVANLAAGISPAPLSAEEVLEAGNAAAPQLRRLLWDSAAAVNTMLEDKP